jgi:3-deoxy-D-manno-octulosonic acid kinase
MAWIPVEEAIRMVLEAHPTLFDWATANAERRASGGRGEVLGVTLGTCQAAVRHFRRGGWMAPLLGDRYLDAPPRPFVELDVSDRLRTAGIGTPRILGAVVTAARPGYRADLATEWLEPGLGLEALLRPGAYGPEDRRAAIVAAGLAVGRAHAVRLDHPDLNVNNVFLQPRSEGGWTVALLDLDRARIRRHRGGYEERNIDRFERSLAKARREGRLGWNEDDRAAFQGGYARGSNGE